MPLIRVQTSSNQIKNSEELLKSLSIKLAELTSKPEKYVMTLLEKDLSMSFSGSSAPCCFVEIKSIGSLNPPIMTREISKIISEMTNINKDRIYIHFEDVNPQEWGFNGNTFG